MIRQSILPAKMLRLGTIQTSRVYASEVLMVLKTVLTAVATF